MGEGSRKALRAATGDLNKVSKSVVDRERQHVHLQVNNAPDLEFEGLLIGEYSTQNAGGTKDRWTEIRLWETPAKDWVVESVGCSSRKGDVNIRDARVIDTATATGDEAILDVMEFLGWTIVAKAFARTMGWNVVLHVA